MKNKQDKFILKAFMAAKIPGALKAAGNHELLAIDDIIGSYCMQLLKNKNKVDIIKEEIITKIEKNAFSKLINVSEGYEKTELAIYYRLAILTEATLYKYKNQ